MNNQQIWCKDRESMGVHQQNGKTFFMVHDQELGCKQSVMNMR